MPRLSETSVPAYRLHRQSGQAIVTLSGRDFLLGKYNSKESKTEYQRRIAEWLAAGRQLPTDPGAITIAEVVVAFRKHAKKYYRLPDGTMSSEFNNMDDALKLVVKLYGRTRAADFSSLSLKAIQEEMISAGTVRTSINRKISRIKHVFKWAAESQIVPASVFHSLSTVSGLRIGRSDAAESEPVQPVAIAHVEAMLQYVSGQIGAMIQLQLLTGMRPGEACGVRTCDIDTTGELWVYKPMRHKNLFRGHDRQIYLGPRAQEIIRPFLKLDTQAFIFSPADAEKERREKMHEQRKTPMSCGNRPGSNRRRKPRKAPGEFYTVESYGRAIKYGCDRAFPPPAEMIDAEHIKQWRKANRFHPHQLRHTCATELRKTFGLEGSQVVLGHKSISATQIYAEKNAEAARKIMAQIG